jgi:predicted amidohydrolase
MFYLRNLWFILLGLLLICISNAKAEEQQNLLDSPSNSTQPNKTIKRPGLVKIATIGSLPTTVDAKATPDEIVRHVINHWKDRFAQVLPDRPDLIVVPENCDVIPGLGGERLFEYCEFCGNRVLEYFKEVAKENHCYVTYPAVRMQEDGTWRNSILLLDRTGEVAGIYRKNYPTISEIEQGILPGSETPIIECDFGRVALVICFDLNFDVLRFKYAKAKPDLIVFCSMYHGGLMQSYWAYSCRSHFVGAIEHKCDSEIYNPLGELVATTTNYFDFVVATVNLDCELAHLDYNQGRLKLLKEKYGPAVTIADPGHLGSVLITSSHESIGVQEMIDEFNIERLDDYLNRAREERVHPGLNKRRSAGSD